MSMKISACFQWVPKMDESIDVEALNKFTSGKQELHQKNNVYAYYKTLI